MNFLVEELIVELQRLPEAKIQTVLEFVRFLSWQSKAETVVKTEEPLLEIAGILSSESLTTEEVERELYDEF